MNSNKLFIIAASLLFTFAFFIVSQNHFGAAAQSAQSKSDEWQIEGEKLTVIEQDGKRILSYEGKVEARLGEYRITGDRLKFYPADKKVVAEENVVFTKKEQSVDCKSVEFYHVANTAKIIITF